MKNYGHVLKAVFETPWAILPATFAQIIDIVRMRSDGVVLDAEYIASAIEAARKSNGPRDAKGGANGVAVIPIYGVLGPHVDLMSEMSGGTSYDTIRSQLRAALKDEDVGSILFDIDSPGGSVSGLDELATEIRSARGQKPMAALARYTAASAAYYLAAQADEVVVTPSGSVGSIGVIAAHQDISGMMEKEGVKTTLITHGQYKAEGNEFEPLTDEAKDEIQRLVDYHGDMFEDAVAAARGVGKEDVAANFGAGRMFVPKKAVKAGLADRIDTFENVLASLSKRALSSAADQGGSTSAYWSAWAPQTFDVLPGEVFTTTSGTRIVPAAEAIPVAEKPFAERLALVADEVEAIAGHAQERARLRAEEGRELSSETREGLRRLLALRPVLDEVEALAAEPAPKRNVKPQLDLLVTAYERGYGSLSRSNIE